MNLLYLINSFLWIFKTHTHTHKKPFLPFFSMHNVGNIINPKIPRGHIDGLLIVLFLNYAFAKIQISSIIRQTIEVSCKGDFKVD